MTILFIACVLTAALCAPYLMSFFYYYDDKGDRHYNSIKMRPHEDFVNEREARLEEEKHAA